MSTLAENTFPVPPNKLVDPVTVKDPLIIVDPVAVKVVPSNCKFASPLNGVAPFPVAVTT